MKSEARLDSLVFQLTPTRTRCDLVIVANGKTEKIASGLLNPFLPHLKAAQDQISKGGYSITLQPHDKSEASWFTKGIVERFVRFVSSPEIVERVNSIESEILQIENEIVIQNNEKVRSTLAKAAESTEGNKSSVDDDAEKAIVLYKTGSQPKEEDSNGSATPGENSKVQLLRVLETRKVVLQKEQAMAFARAVAAGFNIADMVSLLSFAESFGASRLKEACLNFTELWKQKHETGQWIEVENMPESGFSYMNGSGITLAMDSGEALHSSVADITTENGKTENQVPSDGKAAVGPQENVPSQLQQPMYSQWPIYPPSGPLFPSYPMPGVPYYNHPAGVPYFHPAYPPPHDPRQSAPRRPKNGSKKFTEDHRDNSESEESEESTGSQEGSDGGLSIIEKQSSHGRHSHKKGGHSGKKKSGVVVIRNLNYIAKKFGGSESDSQSDSDAETEEATENSRSGSEERKHQQSSKPSKKEGKNGYLESSNAYNNRETTNEPRADSENWQAFQNILFKSEEETTVDKAMFFNESMPSKKGKEGTNEVDPLVTKDHGNEVEYLKGVVEFESANGMATRKKLAASNDDVYILSKEGSSTDDQLKEIHGDGSYRKMASDEFLICRNEKQSDSENHSDPFTNHVYERTTKVEKESALPYNGIDESFMLPYRPESPDHFEQDNRVIIDMDSELPLPPLKVPDSPKKDHSEYIYEPDDFYLATDRDNESVSVGYDPAFEYEFQVAALNVSSTEEIDQGLPANNTEHEANKSEKDKKPVNSLEKRRKDTLIKRGTPSRINPMSEAQKRAEKLRAYKADLQKMKKEQEEEKLKRLEALKLERQKRVATRNSSSRLPVTQQSKIRSSLSKLPSRTNATVTSVSKAESSKLNGTSNGLAQSASTLT